MAISNLEKYRNDLDDLLKEAISVQLSLDCAARGFESVRAEICKELAGDEKKVNAFMRGLKPFASAYQHWYSEALPLVRQLLPDRLSDFVRLYERPGSRKEITYSSYRIEDACQDLEITRNGVVQLDASAAAPLLVQQIAMFEAIKRRFESSLFDIRQLVHADLLDSELGAARELLKNKFVRGAGAIAGVVLEGHLKQVCDNHRISPKSGTISCLNEALKAADVIELSQFRLIQYLGDIRNKCGHRNLGDPTAEEVGELIEGAAKITKTIF